MEKDVAHSCEATLDGIEAVEVDLVNHPPHYMQGEIECIDAIEASLTVEEFRGFCKGTAQAYLWRERHKGGDEDLRKASFYLKRLSEVIKKAVKT